MKWRRLILIKLLTISLERVVTMKSIRMHHIIKTLDGLYPSPPVPLNSVNDFTFLVSVILSAQTTDGKVLTNTWICVYCSLKLFPCRSMRSPKFSSSTQPVPKRCRNWILHLCSG